MKKYFLLLFIISIIAYSNEILLLSNTNLTARSSALKNSSNASVFGAESAIFNPAALSNNNGYSYLFSYTKLFDDLSTTTIAVSSKKFENIGNFGFAFSYLNGGEFIDESNKRTFSSYEQVSTLSFSRNIIDQISSGANLKFYSSKIDTYSSYALGTSLSMLYTYQENKKISIGIYDLGFETKKFNETKEDLPTSIKTALVYKPAKLPADITCEYDYFLYSEDVLSLGIEFKTQKKLIIRGGYALFLDEKENSKTIGTNSKLEKFANLSFGAGFNIKNFNIDFFYAINGELDKEFGLSLTY